MSDTPTRPLILGEAPSRSGDRYWMCPLSGAVGERLARWAGVEPDPDGSRYGRWYWPLVEVFELRNLLERYPGPAGRGAALPTGPARQAWVDLLPELTGRTVVLLAARIPAVAGLPTYFYAWQRPSWCARAVVLPHPSTLNRIYDDPDAHTRAATVLRAAREPLTA